MFVRLLIIVLLAVLLPLRGALAAAVVCDGGERGTRSEQPLHDHVSVHKDLTDHGQHAQDHMPGQAHDGVTHHFAKCASSCSVTPLVSAEPQFAESVAVAVITFPAHAALAASFICGGPERPPRTI